MLFCSCKYFCCCSIPLLLLEHTTFLPRGAQRQPCLASPMLLRDVLGHVCLYFDAHTPHRRRESLSSGSPRPTRRISGLQLVLLCAREEPFLFLVVHRRRLVCTRGAFPLLSRPPSSSNSKDYSLKTNSVRRLAREASREGG